MAGLERLCVWKNFKKYIYLSPRNKLNFGIQLGLGHPVFVYCTGLQSAVLCYAICTSGQLLIRDGNVVVSYNEEWSVMIALVIPGIMLQQPYCSSIVYLLYGWKGSLAVYSSLKPCVAPNLHWSYYTLHC